MVQRDMMRRDVVKRDTEERIWRSALSAMHALSSHVLSCHAVPCHALATPVCVGNYGSGHPCSTSPCPCRQRCAARHGPSRRGFSRCTPGSIPAPWLGAFPRNCQRRPRRAGRETARPCGSARSSHAPLPAAPPRRSPQAPLLSESRCEQAQQKPRTTAPAELPQLLSSPPSPDPARTGNSWRSWRA